MADFREISQAYAQGAIKVVILLNSGAVLACFSQLTQLVELFGHRVIGFALFLWIFGLAAGALAWMLGFFSTRDADITLEQNSKDFSTSNRFMFAGVIAVAGSLLLFLISSNLLAFALAFRG